MKSLITGIDVLKAQLAARGGQADVSKLPPPRPRDENAGPRSQSVYVRGGVEDYMGRGDALGPQEMDPSSPPPGGGLANFGSGEPLPQGDFGGVQPRRTSMNPGFDSSQPQLTQEEPLMGNAVDQRRSSARATGRSGGKGGQEYSFASAVMNDRMDHYNRPPSRAPSRDRSVDRFASRGQTPVPPELINPRSRAPSAQRTTGAAQDWTPDSGVYEDEAAAPISGSSRRSSRPASIISGEAPPLTGNGSVGGGFNIPYTIPATQQEAEKILRQRACGQEIPSCPPTPGQGTVKRTESLYINPIVRRQAQVKVSSQLPPQFRCALLRPIQQTHSQVMLTK